MASKTNNRFSEPVHFGALVATLIWILTSATAIAADSPRTWARGFTWATSSVTSQGKVSLYYIDQNDSCLIGAVSYENKTGKSEAARGIVIKGVLGDDGLFYPDVEFKVRDNSDSEWTGLFVTPIKGKRTEVKIRINEINSRLMVILDPFKPLIGLKQFGKLILSTGDACEFELKHLQPPERDIE